jgi:steroid delta-isomerase-like uncharacterized protein
MGETEDNKRLAARWMSELWSEGDISKAGVLYNPDYVRHDPLGQVNDLDQLKEFVAMFHTGAPDLEFTVEDMVAERDEVLVRWTARGTHRGTILGMAATGNHVTVAGMDLLRFKSGRIVESWPCYDLIGLLMQLGAFRS